MPDRGAARLVIKTPEGVSFSLPLAGPITRFFAWIIDFFAIAVITSAISMFLFWTKIISPDFAQAVLILSYFGVTLGYGMALEWFMRGQTFGKRVMKIRVMDVQGLSLRPSQVIIRNLLRFVDSLPGLYLVGGIAALLSRSYQRLGDYAGNTIVIRSRTTPDYDLSAIRSDKYNSFRDYGHLEARLRQKVTPEETAIAIQALTRREELEPAARVMLMQRLAEHFRSLVTFPESATLGLTDEQYVRNVVDSLIRTDARVNSPEGRGTIKKAV